MTAHLENAALAAWLGRDDDPATLEHLGWCTPCRKEATRMRRALATFRETIYAAGGAREFVWTPPVGARAQAGWHFAVLRWAPRAALAACLLAAVLLMHSPRPAPPPEPSDAADDALLMDIQNDLSCQTPAALAPAESLVAQMIPDSDNHAQGGDQ
jgi:hypothetical protein